MNRRQGGQTLRTVELAVKNRFWSNNTRAKLRRFYFRSALSGTVTPGIIDLEPDFISCGELAASPVHTGL